MKSDPRSISTTNALAIAQLLLLLLVALLFVTSLPLKAGEEVNSSRTSQKSSSDYTWYWYAFGRSRSQSSNIESTICCIYSNNQKTFLCTDRLTPCDRCMTRSCTRVTTVWVRPKDLWSSRIQLLAAFTQTNDARNGSTWLFCVDCLFLSRLLFPITTNPTRRQRRTVCSYRCFRCVQLALESDLRYALSRQTLIQ